MDNPSASFWARARKWLREPTASNRQLLQFYVIILLLGMILGVWIAPYFR